MTTAIIRDMIMNTNLTPQFTPILNQLPHNGICQHYLKQAVMMKYVLSLAIACILHPFCLASDQIPGEPQSQMIVIHGATIHTAKGKTIPGATTTDDDEVAFLGPAIIFDKGKIVGISKTFPTTSPEAQIIDARGKHIYPGMIEAYSNIGLVEVNAVRASVDYREVGNNNPNIRAISAFNPDSEIIPVTRANGILLAVTAPQGSFAGRSSLMMLDGWTWEDMALKQDVGMHLRWRSSEEEVAQLDELFEQAARYRAARASNQTQQPRDLRLEAMGLVLERRMPLIVDASSADEISQAVAFSTNHNVKLIINGGYDAPACAQLLNENNVPVIVSAVYRNPSFRHLAYDDAYTLPKRLHDAGVKFCISAGGRFGASGVRNLPFNAATAAAYGLPPEEALKSVTRYPAEILGVGDRVGALDVGMDATLLVADGDILETATQIEAAFIQGRVVDLNNKHKQLNRKYQVKYRRLKAAGK